MTLPGASPVRNRKPNRASGFAYEIERPRNKSIFVTVLHF